MRTISIKEVLAAYQNIRPLMAPKQVHEFAEALDGQSAVPVFHIGKIMEIDSALNRLLSSTEKYTNDDILVHIHFQKQENNYYITSLTKNEKLKPEAFGYSIVNSDVDAAEFGAIDIAELLTNDAELDIFWESTSLHMIKRAHELTHNLHLRY